MFRDSKINKPVIVHLVESMSEFSTDTIYKKKNSTVTYPVRKDGSEIMLERPVKVNLSDYKKTGENNLFEIYELDLSHGLQQLEDTEQSEETDGFENNDKVE